VRALVVCSKCGALLNPLAGGATPAYRFLSESRAADADSIAIPIAGVQAGTYLVRIQVDGAESPLDINPPPADPVYTGPTLTL